MIPIKIIHTSVCNYYNIDISVPFQKTRKRKHVRYRQIIQYLAYTLNEKQQRNGYFKEFSLEKIGRYYSVFSDKTYGHATVLNSVNKIQGEIEFYQKFSEEINQIKLMISTAKDTLDIKFPEEKILVYELVLKSQNREELRDKLSHYIAAS